MNSAPLSHAIHLGITELDRQGSNFRPNISHLIADFDISSGSSGIIAFAPEEEQSRNNQGYDLVKLSVPDVPDLDITINGIWECAKEHYGLTSATAITGAGGIPVSKLRLGHHWAPGSSKCTNLVSHFGLRFFPMTTLPRKSAAA